MCASDTRKILRILEISYNSTVGCPHERARQCGRPYRTIGTSGMGFSWTQGRFAMGCKYKFWDNNAKATIE